MTLLQAVKFITSTRGEARDFNIGRDFGINKKIPKVWSQFHKGTCKIEVLSGLFFIETGVGTLVFSSFLHAPIKQHELPFCPFVILVLEFLNGRRS